MSAEGYRFLYDVIQTLGECSHRLWWSASDDKISVSINCSDYFFWGSADSEEITPHNLHVLKQSIADARAAHEYGDIWGPELFCARVRGERPQGAAYPEHTELWPLFDACGPEREIGLGNPYKPGEYKPRKMVPA